MLKSFVLVASVGLAACPVYADVASDTTPESVRYSESGSALALSGALQPMAPAFYAGLRMGSYNSSVDNLSFDSAAGLVLGYGTSTLGFELEVNASNVDAAGVPMSYSTAGFYVSARTSSKYFFKFRAGLVEQSMEAALSQNAVVRVDSDFGFSASIGGGVRFTKQALLDFDATVVDQDLTVLSLGINYFF
jgi:hypothetical protein